MAEFAQVVAGTSARHSTLPRPVQELHRAVLRQFLATGATTNDWVRGYAAELDLEPDDALAQLDSADVVHLGEDAVSVAYPFSGTPTAHRVEPADTPTVYAMCAIDALGIPAMAGRDGTITSVDPHAGEPIRVERRTGVWHWQPADAVVLRANTVAPAALPASASPEASGSPVHCCMCPYTNFHTSSGSARAYLTAHHSNHRHRRGWPRRGLSSGLCLRRRRRTSHVCQAARRAHY